jgi:calcineurin-like phosphoesterase family protein
MKTFFVSDLHLWHGNIIKYSGRYWAVEDPDLRDQIVAARLDESLMPEVRIPAEATELMNAYILDKINSKVGPEDRLFILGDIGFANGGNQFRNRVKDLREKLLAGKIYLVWGNHDGRIPMVGGPGDGRPQDREDYRAAIADIFDGVFEQVMVYCEGGIKIFCNHYPMVSWPDAHKNGLPGHAKPHDTISILSYGHVHGAYAKGQQNFRENPISFEHPWAAVDVGVDASRKWPWSAQELWDACQPQVKEIINK